MMTNKASFHFAHVEIYKGEEDSLGIGSYGAVYKARCDELPCAAKILHPVLFQSNDPGASRILQRFEQECSFLNEIRHPNIVLYLGVCRDCDSNLPVLLMELLDESLTKFLRHSESELQFHLQLVVCHDVAIGLSYLHANGIIHRDLSSNNVLLLGQRRAKISDFGMSKLMTSVDMHSMATMCPGTEAYMPPEAMKQPTVCTDKLDCFSFGVLIIQILTRLFPNPGPRTKEVSFPDSPTGTIEMPVLETERRHKHIQLVDVANPMLSLAISCLNYNPSERPTSSDLCKSLSAIQITAKYRDSKQTSAATKRASAVEELQSENTSLKHDLDMIKEELIKKDKLLIQKEYSLKEKNKELQRFQKQMEIQAACEKDEDFKQVQMRDQECQTSTEENEAPDKAVIDELKEAKDDVMKKDLVISQQKAYVSEMQQRLNEAERDLHHVQQMLRKRETEMIDQRNRNSQGSPQVPHRTRKILQDEAGAGGSSILEQTQITSTSTGKAMSKMARGSAAVSGSVVYVRAAGSSEVYMHNINTGEWSMLLPCPLSGFTLVMVGGNLTAIGVYESDSRAVNILLCYVTRSERETKSDDACQWSEKFPPMLTKRYNPAAVSTEHLLIVAGGNLESGEKSSMVEGLDIASQKWYVTTELPVPISQASAVVCDGNLYLIGGIDNNRKWVNLVLTCNVDLLYKNKKQSSRKASGKLRLSRSLPKTKDLEWRLAANLPVGRATACCVKGKLLAVGGIPHCSTRSTRRIHVYNTDGNFWEVIGHLATARSQCLIGSLEKSALIVGGWLDSSAMTDDVEILELL